MKIVYSPAFLVLLLVLFLLVGRAVWGLYPKEQAAAAARARTAEQLRAQIAERERLEAQVEFLNTDRGREEELRQKFPVARPGEHVLTIPPATPDKN